MSTVVTHEALVPPQHIIVLKLGSALHIDALTLITTLHLLTPCRLAVCLAHRRCPSPLPAGPGEAAARSLDAIELD